MCQKFKQDISIGKNIRKLRKESHLTQEEVVAKLQINGIKLSRSVYSQIELGTYNIRISEFLCLKKIFNAKFEDFFEGL